MTEETPRRARALASGLLIVTFVVGALFGAAGDRVLSAGESQVLESKPAVDPQGEPRREAEREKRGSRGSIMLDPKVLDELGTTPEQRAKINALLARRDQETKRIWEEMKPRFDTVMSESRIEIRSQLNADQLKKLDAIIAQRQAERKARHEQNRKNPTAPKSPRDSAPGKSSGATTEFRI